MLRRIRWSRWSCRIDEVAVPVQADFAELDIRRTVRRDRRSCAACDVVGHAEPLSGRCGLRGADAEIKCKMLTFELSFAVVKKGL